MDLWLVRHGETTWSRTGQHTGKTDLQLTDAGREQARAAAQRLEGRSFDAVRVSPASRAVQTADALGRDYVVDDDLVEFDYGEYEGMTTVQVRTERHNWDLWTGGCPGGETAADVGTRVDAVLQRLVEAGVKQGMLVGHSHTLRILAARYLGLPPEMGRLFKLDTATVSVLSVYHSRPVLSTWNAPV